MRKYGKINAKKIPKIIQIHDSTVVIIKNTVRTQSQIQFLLKCQQAHVPSGLWQQCVVVVAALLVRLLSPVVVHVHLIV